MIRTRFPAIKICRYWAMPSKDTFSIKPIRDFIRYKIKEGMTICDPFVGNSPFKDLCVSNDINPLIKADSNMDALSFLRHQKCSFFDMVLFDPPYSARQVSECYKNNGLSVDRQTTSSKFWSDIKKEIQRITKHGGMCISFGWNSGGVGKKYGFEIYEIVLIAHGGAHNDTIVTLEYKGLKKGERERGES